MACALCVRHSYSEVHVGECFHYSPQIDHAEERDAGLRAWRSENNVRNLIIARINNLIRISKPMRRGKHRIHETTKRRVAVIKPSGDDTLGKKVGERGRTRVPLNVDHSLLI